MKGSISFCEVVQTFLIPRLERALVRKLFYHPSEIAGFRQEAYLERHCLQKDPVVEDNKDQYDHEADFDPPNFYNNNESTKEDSPPRYPQRKPRIMWQSIAPEGSPTIMASKKSTARQVQKQSAYLDSISSLAVTSMEMDIPPPPPTSSTERLDNSPERNSVDHLDMDDDEDGDMEVEAIAGRRRKEEFLTADESRGTNHPLFHRLTAKRQRNKGEWQKDQQNNRETSSLNQNIVLSLSSTYGLFHNNNSNNSNNTRLPIQNREAWLVALL